MNTEGIQTPNLVPNILKFRSKIFWSSKLDNDVQIFLCHDLKLQGLQGPIQGESPALLETTFKDDYRNIFQC